MASCAGTGTSTPLLAVQCSSKRAMASRIKGALAEVGIASGKSVSKNVAIGSDGLFESSLFSASCWAQEIAIPRESDKGFA